LRLVLVLAYKCRALSEWLERPSDSYRAAAQYGYRLYGGIVVHCHRTRARRFERSSRDEKPSPLLDDDAFLPFQVKGVDSSASSALTAQDGRLRFRAVPVCDGVYAGRV
jgi:hypothetical protein